MSKSSGFLLPKRGESVFTMRLEPMLLTLHPVLRASFAQRRTAPGTTASAIG